MSDSATPTHRRSMAKAAVGTGLVVAYAFLAALQILVLNPLASVPGKNLGEIYAEVEAAGESMGVWVVIANLLLGPAIAITLLVLRARRRPMQPARATAIPYLALLVLGAPAYFWASFGPGMSLADTFMPETDFRWSSSAPRRRSRARVETPAKSPGTVTGSRHASSFLVGYSINGCVFPLVE